MDPLNPKQARQNSRSKDPVQENLKIQLFSAILQLRTVDELNQFFDDLCTPAELTAMADRWQVVQLLAEQLPYRTICERTGVSTATITRVARAIAYGTGGYEKALQLMSGETQV